MMTVLESIRDKLATVAGVATCKIGMEANLTPADYPMVRIVPSTITNGSFSTRKCEMLIYFGLPIHEFTGGLEALYVSLFAMEDALLIAARSMGLNLVYIETVLDEDKLAAYKLMALRLTVEG